MTSTEGMESCDCKPDTSRIYLLHRYVHIYILVHIKIHLRIFIEYCRIDSEVVERAAEFGLSKYLLKEQVASVHGILPHATLYQIAARHSWRHLQRSAVLK